MSTEKNKTNLLRITTKEQEELVLNNLNLVHHIIKQINIADEQYEDIVSIGNIALVKAAVLYNHKMNIKFSTYASKSIENTIWSYLERREPDSKIYLYDIVTTANSYNEEVFLADTIEDPNWDFTYEIEQKEDFLNVINTIANFLLPCEKQYMFYLLAGNTKSEINEKMNIRTRQRANQIESRAKERLETGLKITDNKTKGLKISKDGNMYTFTFYENDTEKLKRIYNQSLYKIKKFNCKFAKCEEHKMVIKARTEEIFFELMANIIEYFPYTRIKVLVENDT